MYILHKIELNVTWLYFM